MVKDKCGVVESQVEIGQADVVKGRAGEPLDEMAEIIAEIPYGAPDERNFRMLRDGIGVEEMSDLLEGIPVLRPLASRLTEGVPSTLRRQDEKRVAPQDAVAADARHAQAAVEEERMLVLGQDAESVFGRRRRRELTDQDRTGCHVAFLASGRGCLRKGNSPHAEKWAADTRTTRPINQPFNGDTIHLFESGATVRITVAAACYGPIAQLVRAADS